MSDYSIECIATPPVYSATLAERPWYIKWESKDSSLWAVGTVIGTIEDGEFASRHWSMFQETFRGSHDLFMSAKWTFVILDDNQVNLLVADLEAAKLLNCLHPFRAAKLSYPEDRTNILAAFDLRDVLSLLPQIRGSNDWYFRERKQELQCLLRCVEHISRQESLRINSIEVFSTQDCRDWKLYKRFLDLYSRIQQPRGSEVLVFIDLRTRKPCRTGLAVPVPGQIKTIRWDCSQGWIVLTIAYSVDEIVDSLHVRVRLKRISKRGILFREKSTSTRDEALQLPIELLLRGLS